jgi:hypothetical protein
LNLDVAKPRREGGIGMDIASAHMAAEPDCCSAVD